MRGPVRCSAIVKGEACEHVRPVSALAVEGVLAGSRIRVTLPT